MGFVTDSLDSLDFFLYSHFHFSLTSNLRDRFFPTDLESFDYENDFWDCECDEDFIHHKAIESECSRCGTFEEEQPDSIPSEVIALGWV
ncbi:hypothetical protein CH375_18635 [Leptospira ellisii]|nr:hypothetical protein CH375_18635 [Leptospira ellisii]